MNIEKGIPIPCARGIEGYGIGGIMRQMEVGDSMLVPDNYTRNGILKAGRALRPMTFTTRKTREGFRVWRTA